MPRSAAASNTSLAGTDASDFATVTHHASFSVPFRYPVIFTRSVFDPANPVLAQTLCAREPEKQHRVLVLFDDGVVAQAPELPDQWLAYASYYGDSLLSAGTPIIVPGGESIKGDADLLARLSQYIELNNIDRHSYILAIGGGAMLDAVGLAAATAHRGVRLVRLPTTVLAQNDAGIGVKNGINLFGQKNWYGTFAPPFAVINDSDFLKTLGPVEQRAGMAEAIKVALIRDAEFFGWIESNSQALARFDTETVRYLIERCAQLHLHQITQGGDPFEQGTARPLDFGHWAAHRLEKMTRHRIGHGDAVAIGIALDSRYACLTDKLNKSELQRILQVLDALGFPAFDDALNNRDSNGRRSVLGGLDDFQRHLGGELTVTLPESIGVGVEVHHMEISLLDAALIDMDPGSQTCA